ncbi:MAG TPA: GFA family protein [Rhodocyclaceae bacterium]|nr:GFA family protein [Rhodocyclaceae bacterium]
MHLPEMPPPYFGYCLCGKVHYKLTELPLTFYACHCIDCQRRTGGAMRLAMWVNRSAITVIEGAPELQVFELGDGRQRRAKVCAQCDTRLWAEPSDKPDLSILLPGTLQNQNEFEPIAHIWTQSALPWVTIPANAVKYETQPENSKELIQIWQRAIAQHDFKNI